MGSTWKERLKENRLARLLKDLLTQGLGPAALARTLAVSTVCSLLPVFGATSLLNLGAGALFKLNHPVMQILNQLLGPVQLLMIYPYVKAGEWLWGAQAGERFVISEVLELFARLPIGEFLARFGMAGLHAVSAWALSAPLLYWAIYYPSRGLLLRMAAACAASRP
jgi:hypothetical protein